MKVATGGYAGRLTATALRAFYLPTAFRVLLAHFLAVYSIPNRAGFVTDEVRLLWFLFPVFFEIICKRYLFD
jgi:hypothetical protein